MTGNHEPSVLDYLKSILIPGRKHIEIPAPMDETEPEDDDLVEVEREEPERKVKPVENSFLKPEHPFPG